MLPPFALVAFCSLLVLSSSSLGQSPDVSPVKCPPDAFCPSGSVEPTYCMELFLYKAGDSCQLTPATVIVLATFSAGESGSVPW